MLFCGLVNMRRYAWAEKNDKISSWLGGFGSQIGCDIQAFRLLASIFHQFDLQKSYKNIVQGRLIICFVDFRKAYGSVKHRLPCIFYYQTGNKTVDYQTGTILHIIYRK